jgi:RND family efflux transporter MFP subunit
MLETKSAFSSGFSIRPSPRPVVSASSPTTAAIWGAICLAAGGFLVSCSGGSASDGAARKAGGGDQPRPVRVVAASEDRLVRAISVTGTLAAEEQVTISMKVAGRLDQLSVDLGSRVTNGQVVARLVPTDFSLRVGQAEAALAQARARLGLAPDGKDDVIDPEKSANVREARAVLDQAKLTRDRMDTFFKRGISSRADFDSADAAFKVAESRYQDAIEEVRNRQGLLQQRRSELDQARQQLEDSQLTSPMDGMVRERLVTVGQYLAVGTPVVTIVRMHPLRLRLAVPEREAPGVKLTQEVLVHLEGDTTVYRGRVARISPAIEETNRTLMVEAQVPNPQSALRPGSFARADIVMQAQDKAIVVPTSAIVTFAGVDKVIVVREGKSLEKRVNIGRRDGARVEIVSGLDAGEQVIVNPGNLVSGERVSIVSAENVPPPQIPAGPAR